MEKFANKLFSMRAMALAMFIFLSSIGIATFIESAYGVQAAKLWVYNALWFEILLAFLSMNLIANIFRYNMLQREKIALLTFHLSFLVIIIGAAITRYTGYEGLMLIREGKSANFIYTADPHLVCYVSNGKENIKVSRKLLLSEVNFNDFSMDIEMPNHKEEVTIEYVNFKSKHIDSLVLNDSIKSSALEIVTNGKVSNYVTKNEVFEVGNVQIAFGNQQVNGVNVYSKNGQLVFRPTADMQFIPMAEMQKARETGVVPDSAYRMVKANEEVPFATTTLYQIGGEQFVFKQEIPHATKKLLPSGRKDVGLDYLVVKVSNGKQSKTVTLEGGVGIIPASNVFFLGDLRFALEYGSAIKPVPFSIQCDDFMIERYPGSDVPSSYASDLQILDTANKYFKKKRVFMNHVLDYNGFRFFQSAYDPDEKGTRLSVNHDYWGTNITYLGYLLMGIGMILSLLAPTGRFRGIIEKLNKSREKRILTTLALVVSFSFLHTSASAQTPRNENSKPIFRVMSEEHSEELASLLVQDFDGRIVPMHTVCDQLLRKIHYSNSYEKYNAIQTIMSVHMYPDHWITQPLIYVPTALRSAYKLNDYESFKTLSDKRFQFKWLADYNTALQKRESERSETQKKLIKLVERYQVYASTLQFAYLKWVPVKNDATNTWYIPLSQELMLKDTTSSKVVLYYLSALDRGSKSGNYREAVKLLGDIKAFQRETAPAKILPSESLVKTEISYNKMNIFKNSKNLYLLIALVLMVVYFVRIFVKSSLKANKRFDRIRKIFVGILAITTVYHASGLAMRWYISGHAPWSNGYEAVVFIALITMLAGFIFSRKNAGILAGTALLAAFMIMVTEMNLLDPEITPLQPVLKSYWLMIHVAVITGSYGFLGLAAILGLFNLTLYISRNQLNAERVNPNINELTYVAEMTMTIGLFMLTIGTFLGGIWANESWGRYWGWDPKETWALVSVLVYAIILHLRFIPALNSKFTFNVVSLWGYSAILFTFFGVNFILVGLHSYAQGDGAVGLPPSVIITFFAFLGLTIWAGIRNASYKKKQVKS